MHTHTLMQKAYGLHFVFHIYSYKSLWSPVQIVMLAFDYKQLHLGNHTEKGIASGCKKILFLWENKVVAVGQKIV